VCIITKPTVTNSHRPGHTYQKLPEFGIKLRKQKLLKRVIIKAISVLAQYDELFIYLFISIVNRSLLLVNTSQLAENLNYFK